MAKRLNTVNFVYTAIGLAIVGGVTYYAVRRYRQNRIGIEGQSSFGQPTTSSFGETSSDTLMDLRRSTRKAGRAVKDAATGIGKNLKRGASDVGEAVEDGAVAGNELLQQEAGYKTKY